MTRHRALLTMLIDGPSRPNLALRMGMTEEETQELIAEVRSAGILIDETKHTVNNKDGEDEETVVYTLSYFPPGSVLTQEEAKRVVAEKIKERKNEAFPGGNLRPVGQPDEGQESGNAGGSVNAPIFDRGGEGQQAPNAL